MKNLILDAIKIGVDLRVEQNKRSNHKYSTCETNIHDMIKDSANMIDTLAAALMISEETIKRLAKMANISEEDLNKILNIIGSSEARMIEAYNKK